MRQRRQARINELIRHSISEIIERGLKRSFSGMITITNVKASPDLSVAWVEFTVIGADEETAVSFLQSSRHEIISQMAEKVRLRSLPELRFSPDKTLKRARRIEELIREIHKDE
jgi:ribosome-binding factor A